MLRAVAFVLQSVLAALVAYTTITALAGWRTPKPPPVGDRRRRFVVLIPAHDEERVVGRAVSDVRLGEYPSNLYEVWVIADRCSDGTAVVARDAGAKVAERVDGPGGKGAALAWFLEQRPIGPDEAVVVIDADNHVPPNILVRLSDELDSGAAVVQVYLDATDPGASWISMATALSYWASNRMVQLSRHNLAWPVDLGGTGMCLTAAALEAAGGIGASLVEDQDLTARLTLEGVRVHWVHDVRVHDEKPLGAGVAVRQRARWAAGKRASARRHAMRLAGAALRRRRWGPADLALRLVQPSRTLVAGVSALLAVVAVVATTDLLWPWEVWAGIAVLQFVLPISFLFRDGVAPRWIVRYPVLVVLALLWLPVQLVSRWVAGWYHTPHRG